MSPLTLGRRRLRFPDPPCPRGSSLRTHDVRMRVYHKEGSELLGSRSRRCWFRAKASGPPSKTGATPLLRVHQVRRSKQRKRPGLSPASKKSEVIHLRRDNASALAWNALAGLVFESPSASGCYFRLSARPWIAVFLFFSFFSFLLPFRQISFIRGITRHVHAA